MRIGMVSPYPWDVPGGVVAHIRDLSETLAELGHEVSVISPVKDPSAPLPAYVASAGRRTVPVLYNGAVAHLMFGPVSAARMRRWVREGGFDLLHVHSPETLSLSLLGIVCARGPIVSTNHMHSERSRILALAQTPLQTQLEKVQARIAVSPAARRTMLDHLGLDSVVIPNGVRVARFATAAPLPGRDRDGATIGFLGRIDEPRKGLAVLLDAFELLAETHPAARLVVAGPGDAEEMREVIPRRLAARVEFLGLLDEKDKARFYRSVDVFVAPNLGGESFGIVLLEAMAAGTPVLASDLEAFRLVLADGAAGRLFPVGDPVALAQACGELLDTPGARTAYARAAGAVVAAYDWASVAERILSVYETVRSSGGGAVREDNVEAWGQLSSPSSRWSLSRRT